jgi:AraC-like DNA-binding protein
VSSLSFFRSGPVVRLLERAARSGGVPLSLHYVNHGTEGPRILGWGGCEACRHAASIPAGVQRCRDSRLEGSEGALRHSAPLPFVCHLGLVCTAIPALPEQQFVLVFGPYCPAEESRSLEYDARRGLESLLGEPLETLPFTLDDVHRAPAACIPALAEWTIEALTELWASAQAENEESANAAPEEASLPVARRSQRSKTPPKGDPASEIAAALLSGNQPLARTLFRGALAEVHTARRVQIALSRARTLHLSAAVLEAVERAGVGASESWGLLGRMVEEVQGAGQERELLDAAMRVLGGIRRQAVRQRGAAKASGTNQTAAADYPELTAILTDRLTDNVRLGEVAKLLGETPSAISHRLQRKFGMSFSGYLNRLRMDRAKELLRRTRLSATEIAGRVGVGDQSNFGRLFRKSEGMTPIEYRERFGRKR